MLAIIIPSLNVQSVLPRLVASLETPCEEAVRLIISDGGSTDETIKIGLASGAVFACGRRGRGAQLARGADLAKAVDAVDSYLFLHADCQLMPGWRGVVDAALMDQNTAWYFKYRPDASGLGGFWLRCIVGLRNRAWGLPYGDQGLLIPRAMYEALGGYDQAKPLFEDVDIVDRIKAQFGRKALRALPMALKTDISDHLREGIFKRGWRNFKLLRAYRSGVSVDELLGRYT